MFRLRYGQRKQDDAIREVHVLVNSQLSDVLSRVDQLKSALHDAGVPIPAKPSDVIPSGDKLPVPLRSKP
jgi:hypothetical protein